MERNILQYAGFPDHLLLLGDTTGGDVRDRVTRQPIDADIPCLLRSELASELGANCPEKAVGRCRSARRLPKICLSP